MDHEVFHRPLSALKVRRPVWISEDAAAREALHVMQDREEPCVLVGSKQETVGIITERDFLLKVAGKDAESLLAAPLADHMTPNPKMLANTATVGEALATMNDGGYRHVPITDDDGNVVGLISVTDVIDFLVIHFPEEILNPWFDIKPGDAYG